MDVVFLYSCHLVSVTLCRPTRRHFVLCSCVVVGGRQRLHSLPVAGPGQNPSEPQFSDLKHGYPLLYTRGLS